MCGGGTAAHGVPRPRIVGRCGRRVEARHPPLARHGGGRLGPLRPIDRRRAAERVVPVRSVTGRPPSPGLGVRENGAVSEGAAHVAPVLRGART